MTVRLVPEDELHVKNPKEPFYEVPIVTCRSTVERELKALTWAGNQAGEIMRRNLHNPQIVREMHDLIGSLSSAQNMLLLIRQKLDREMPE